MQARSFRVLQPAGPTLSVHEWGAGEPTFVLIHGFGDGGFIWDEFLPNLTSFGRAIAIDLRGHGDADWHADAQYDTASHLDDVSFLLEALGLNKFVLIGHSLGGEIAIRLAAQHSGRVIGLVVVDFGPELNRTATAHIRRDFIAENQIYPGHSEYVAHLKMKLPLISPERCDSLAKSALQSRAEGGYELKRDPALADPVRVRSLPALWPMLKDILCPTLVVRGIASSVLPLWVAKRMVQLIPKGSLASISLAGHAVMIDNPEDFSAVTLRFIRETVLAG